MLAKRSTSGGVPPSGGISRQDAEIIRSYEHPELADGDPDDLGWSDLTVQGSGFYRTLREMGADITFLNEREEGGEAIADIRARHGELVGVTVPPERAPAKQGVA